MPGISTETKIHTPNNGVWNKLYITAEESKEPEEAKVEGKIPSYITGGKYLRVGPSKFDFPDFTVNHWLDGYALISKFEIQDDSIAFEKKYLQTDVYKKAMVLQKPAVNEFATKAQADAKKGFFSRVISALMPEFTDNSYSTLFQLGQDLFATCDTQFFHKINSSGLNVECRCDTLKQFNVNGHCAHPVTDSNGDVYNFGFSIGATGTKYHLLKIPFAKTSEEMMKNSKILTTISPRWTGQLASAHSFGMTENYLILIEQPYTVSAKRVAASLIKGDTLKDWLEWRPEEKNKFYIIEKSTGKLLKTEFFTATAFYFLHFVNCYEESNQIIVDIIAYDSPNLIDSLMLSNLRENKNMKIDLPYLQRFVVPIIPDLKVANLRENLNLVNSLNTSCTAMRNGSKIIITGERLTGCGVDMPAINKRFFGKKIRYMYASGSAHESEFTNNVCKVDLETKEMLKWTLNSNIYPGEPVFVADPKGTKEDEGVLIVPATDKRLGHDDYLIFLDAQNLTELGRANFKSHVPASLHGIFLPN